MTADAVLTIENLRVRFGAAEVVRGISLSVAAGECVAIVGESGSGKSVTARALLGLAGSGSTVTADTMRLSTDSGVRDLLRVRPRAWRRIRGGEVGLVLQDALVSLDPLRPVGREIDDVLRLHTSLSPRERRSRVREILASVGMPDPEERARQRSGELSGGLRQRALIASAIAADPPCSSPTSRLRRST
ncbi:ATP-binding cassette domain-containing protein [Salinibacterium hongtaonis]|uniref:ATP-binding cassette domain-containing protein n=1 Tax=Homoserinimonas hongtaonis TaxID=2079791 RepID=UPI0030D440DD